MSAPLGWVLSTSVASRLGPVQDGLDPPSHPRRRLGLLVPNGFQDLHDERGIDRLYQLCPDDWVHVAQERGPPLSAMLVVAPSRLVSCDVGLPTRLEGDQLRFGNTGSLSGELTHLNRVYARNKALPAFLRGHPSCCQRHGRKGPEPHLPRSLRKSETEQPALAASVRDAEVQPPAITMVAGLLEVLHPKRCQPVGRPACW